MTRMTAAQYRAHKPKKEPKYRNAAVEIDGVRFDSKGEAKRWRDLCRLQACGAISDLERQVQYELHNVDGSVACRFRPDFRYVEDGAVVVEDYKSSITMTPIFRLKRKMFEAEYGITLRLSGVES